MNIVSLNIETQPIESRVAELPEPEIAMGNLKDPEKIAAKKSGAAWAQRQRMALDPHFGSVACVTFVGKKTTTKFAAEIGEDRLLRATWEALAKIDRLITFNGAGFDIPFLRRRAQLLGIPTCPIEINKYCVCELTCPHVDMMQVLHQGEPGWGNSNPLNVGRTLSYYVKQFLGEDWPMRELDQSKLGELIASGPEGMQTVRLLCEWNTEYALKLYHRVGLVQPAACGGPIAAAAVAEPDAAVLTAGDTGYNQED